MVTRIRQLLEQKQLTPTQFADIIGVGRPVMSHILSERNKPSLEVVQRIIEAFPEVSMLWLLKGTGEMLESDPKPQPTELSPASPAKPEAPIMPALPVELPTIEPALPTEASASTVETPAAPDAASLTQEKEVTTQASALPATAPAPKRAVNTIGNLPRVSSSLAADIPAPVASALSSGPAAPPVSKPFAAPRFVRPSVPRPDVTPALAPQVVAPALVPVAAPASLPVAATPAAPLASPASGGDSANAALLPFLNDSGKAIRRIVIFYRDGSFADYQPEQ